MTKSKSVKISKQNPRFRRSPHKHYMTPEKLEYHAQLLSNRIRKQFRHFSRKFRKQNIDCFRLYDWDIKEIRAVVDWYKGHIMLAEYERTQTGPLWLPRMAEAVAQTLSIPEDHVHMRRRRTQAKDGARYEKPRDTGERFQVNERDLKFWVNLSDYLDTGLFSDHRDTRVMVRAMVKGKSFLNLYAYTGAFTCAAAAGGAKSTATVDRSGTYLNWAKENLALNRLQGKQHAFIKSDTFFFLERAFRQRQRFDICFVDPPSFSEDKLRGKGFDVNRDHPHLLTNILKIMAKDGIVLFSTNHQRFEPKFDGLNVNDLQEITLKTIPEDYRNKHVHRLWRMRAA
ncbi:MAG: class I SAM-dependent methyltransferase [Candidatus Omnitrophota bacterium]